MLHLVLSRLVQAEAAEFDQPHIVLVSGAQFTTYEGPYPDAISALMAAAQEEEALAQEAELTISIAPLMPPRRPQ